MPPRCWNSSANKPSYEANLDYTVAPKCCSSCFQKVGSIQLVTHAQQASLVMVWICFSFFMGLPDQQFSIFDDLKVKTTLGPPLQSFCPSGLKDQRDEFRLFLWLWLRYAVGKTKTVIEVTILVFIVNTLFSPSHPGFRTWSWINGSLLCVSCSLSVIATSKEDKQEALFNRNNSSHLRIWVWNLFKSGKKGIEWWDIFTISFTILLRLILLFWENLPPVLDNIVPSSWSDLSTGRQPCSAQSPS